MTKQLYLLRHAEPEPWSPLGNDFTRPLNANGHQHAVKLAEWAHDSLPAPDTVLCSPAKRTRETLAPILAQWRRLLAHTDYVDSMYGASLNLLLTLAEDAFSYSDRLLMIGHNPGFDFLMTNLLPKASQSGHMDTGTFAVIEFEDEFKRNSARGKLLQLIQRKDLFVS